MLFSSLCEENIKRNAAAVDALRYTAAQVRTFADLVKQECCVARGTNEGEYREARSP